MYKKACVFAWQEGDMPIEDLLAMYGYNNGEPPSVTTSQTSDSRSSSEEEILSNQDLTLDKEEIARDLLSNSEDTDDKETDVHDLLESVESSQTARLLRCKIYIAIPNKTHALVHVQLNLCKTATQI